MMTYLTKQQTRTAADSGSEEARRRLTGWGAAPLLFFALLPDKRYLLSEPGGPEWGVAYRVVGRQALALGDPFGDPKAAPEAIAGFLELCRRQGWKPVFYQTTPEHLKTYRQSGLNTVKVGEDAQIALADFSLVGKRYVKLRNDLRRIEKAGVVLETYGPDAPPSRECIAEMDAISRGWRKAHRANEGWFAMGGFDPQSQLFAESRYFVARDSATGRMLAFTSFVPIFGAGEVTGWTLDLMRRQANALHGVMDFLIVSAASQFATESAHTVSLGLSPLAGADDPAEAAATSHIRRFLYTRLNRAYNFQGLHTFKGKFATHWEPRYLAYSGRMALASASGAVLKAHLTPPASPRPRQWHLRSSHRRGFAVFALLLLGLAPFEKTLAKRAVVHPVKWSHLRTLSYAHLSYAHLHLHPLHFHHSAKA
jgi:phosphatidylglycerol lysyltransferase